MWHLETEAPLVSGKNPLVSDKNRVLLGRKLAILGAEPLLVRNSNLVVVPWTADEACHPLLRYGPSRRIRPRFGRHGRYSMIWVVLAMMACPLLLQLPPVRLAGPGLCRRRYCRDGRPRGWTFAVILWTVDHP
jgi:hypothetical protein